MRGRVPVLLALALAAAVVPLRIGPAAAGEEGPAAWFLSNHLEGGDADAIVYFGLGNETDFSIGDWDGDGIDDLARRRGNEITLRNAVNGLVWPVAYGKAGDDLRVGDWDGDGIDTLAVRRGNLLFIKNTIASGPADIVIAYGRAGDELFVGDWNGDDIDTLAVRRHNVLFVRNSLSTGSADAVFAYGRASDALGVGDWDRSGADTFVVRRPSTELIAYWRGSELWLMEADGSNPGQLHNRVALDIGPAWSPDGTRIAFTGVDRYRPPGAGWSDIWVIDADGTGLRNVTSQTDSAALGHSWSPDGTRLVYATTDWDLWVIDADGTDRLALTSDTDRQNDPAWSPDGSLIAYCSTPVVDRLISGDVDIWVSEPDGANPRQLTHTGDSCSPAWSPDGTQITFRTYVFPADPTTDHSDVWVMDADGTNHRNLTNDPTRFDGEPAWSPDRTRIAFHSAGPFRVRVDPVVGEIIEHHPPSDIFVTPAAGGPRTQLTFGDQADAAPSWQPAP